MAVIAKAKFVSITERLELKQRNVDRRGGGPPIYLIPDFEDLSKAKRWLKKHYLTLFEEVLSEWPTDESDRPKDLSYKTVTQWFDPEFNLMVFDP